MLARRNRPAGLPGSPLELTTAQRPKQRVLLEQKFVKDNGISVKQYLEQNSTPLVKTFYRIQLGENS
jgi:elongation factor Ts